MLQNLPGKLWNALSFDGKLGGVDIFKNPTFNGFFNVSAFNPKTLLQTLGLATPNFQNKNAFTNVALNSQFIVTPKTLAINNLKLGLDQSTLTGNVYLALTTSRTQSQFNLTVDKIDLSNYLARHRIAAAAAITPQRQVQVPQHQPLLLQHKCCRYRPYGH